MTTYDALVLAGGAGRRLGGVSKAAVLVAGRTLLSRALDAVSSAERVVVVGVNLDVPDGVLQVTEHPPSGGPVAGIAAGLPLVGAPLVAVLAVDVPLLHVGALDELAAVVGSGDGAVFVDEGGRRQHVVAVYRVDALQRALSGLPTAHGAAMRTLVADLDVAEVPASGDDLLDCDSWDEVERASILLAPLVAEVPGGQSPSNTTRKREPAP